MVNYYVKPTADGGSDAAAGTSVATAWATIGKAIGASGMASGDTVYVAPGTYREVLTIGVTPSAETFVLADPQARQFPGLVGGPVILSAYLTNDTTAPSATALITTNTKHNMTWEGFDFIVGTNVLVQFGTSHDWTFRDCTFYGRTSGASHTLTHTTTAGATSDLLFERCIFVSFANGSQVYSQICTLHTADYDVNIVFRRCRFFAANGTIINLATTGGSGTGKPGGVDLTSCDFYAGAVVLNAPTAQNSGTIPHVVRYCLFAVGGATALNADAAGIIDEDWNRFAGTTPRSGSVATGANSLATNAHAFAPLFGQEARWGGRPRPAGSPPVGSPLLGFVSSAQAVPTTDALNRPAPSGGASMNFAVGALERHDAGRKGITLGADAGSGYLELVGPGDQDFQIPVDAAATTITVRVIWDANHADTNKPQASILHGGEVGWPDETKTAVGTQAGSVYETLTFTTRTPSKAGIVTLRLISRSAAGGGLAAFDSVAVTT